MGGALGFGLLAGGLLALGFLDAVLLLSLLAGAFLRGFLLFDLLLTALFGDLLLRGFLGRAPLLHLLLADSLSDLLAGGLLRGALLLELLLTRGLLAFGFLGAVLFSSLLFRGLLGGALLFGLLLRLLFAGAGGGLLLRGFLRGFLLLDLHQAALLGDLILLLFLTLLRFRLGLLALHLVAGEPFLCGIHLFALLLRGPRLLVGCFLLLLGGKRGGFGSLFLPLGGGVGLGLEFACRPLLLGAKLVGVGLRGPALVEVHFLFLQIGPFLRSGCGLLGGVLFAGRGGAGFGSALLVHAGPVGADLLGIHLVGALLLRLQLLPLGVRLGAGYARGFGCRPGWRDGWINPRWSCSWCRWLALHGDGSPGFAGRMKAPGGFVGISLLPGLSSHAADDRRD